MTYCTCNQQYSNDGGASCGNCSLPIQRKEEKCCEKCGFLETELGGEVFRKPVCAKENCPCHKPPTECTCGCHTSDSSDDEMKKNGCDICYELYHKPPTESWRERLRSLWQTTRENQGKYQKIADFIAETLQADRKRLREEVGEEVNYLIRLCERAEEEKEMFNPNWVKRRFKDILTALNRQEGDVTK